MNLKRHHVLYIFLAVSLIIGMLVLLAPRTLEVSYTDPKTATSTATAMQFEVVTTEAAQERGLGGRPSIPQDYGMLFVFAKEQKVGFWMKDMQASIDMIWLSDNGTILGIEDSVAPSTYPKQIFYPPKPVKYVLETKAGEAHRKGWEVGTHIQLPLPYGS